jgi:rubrerythrin
MRCHKVVQDDTICCAELRHTWKCKACGKLTTGFVVPYRRCFLCGGEIETVKPYEAENKEVAQTVEEALQYEVNMLQFYRLGRARTKDPHQRELFDDMARMEREHIDELQEKYHVHLDPRVLDMVFDAEETLASWLFEGIDLEVPEGVLRPLYEKALEMERRTRDHFRKRAEDLPPGFQKEVYRELAAEEDEHIAILETELAQLDEAEKG